MVGGGGCFNNRGEASFQGLFLQKASSASCIISRIRDLAAMSAPRCAGPAVSRALLYPIPDWPALSVACSELSSVSAGKSLSRGPLPVVDTADAKTLAKESNVILRILAQLNTFVHCSNDVYFGQELVRDELTGSHGDSECAASSSDCGDRGHFLHVVNFPFRWGCVQDCDVVDDFCFLRVFALLQLCRWRHRNHEGWTAPGSDGRECHRHQCNRGPIHLHFPAEYDGRQHQ